MVDCDDRRSDDVGVAPVKGSPEDVPGGGGGGEDNLSSEALIEVVEVSIMHCSWFTGVRPCPHLDAPWSGAQVDSNRPCLPAIEFLYING